MFWFPEKEKYQNQKVLATRQLRIIMSLRIRTEFPEKKKYQKQQVLATRQLRIIMSLSIRYFG